MMTFETAIPEMNIEVTVPETADSLRLGAHADAAGVHFAVYSAHAERIELCLFADEDGRGAYRNARGAA